MKPLGAPGRNLQRRFELHGYFWVPTREREMIEGTLSYDPGRPPTLRLARLFSDEAPDDAFFEGPQPRDLVYGMDHGGELMTLYRLGAGQVLGGSLARYECEIAALGDHFAEDEQLDTLRVRIAGLERLFGSDGIRVTVERDRPDREPKKVHLDYELPPSLHAEVDESYALALHYYLDLDGEYPWPTSSFKLTERVALTIYCLQPTFVKRALLLQRACRQFLTLALGTGVWPLQIEGRTTTMQEVDFLIQLGVPIGDLTGVQPLFDRSVVPNPLELLAAWLRREPDLDTVYELAADASQRRERSRTRFLGLSQALEVYHRKVLGPDRMVFSKRLQALLDRLADTAPQVVKAISDPSSWGPGQSWPKRIAAIRNGLTHHTDIADGYPDRAEQTRRLDEMQIVLELNLLLFELGFPGEIVDHLIQTVGRYQAGVLGIEH